MFLCSLTTKGFKTESIGETATTEAPEAYTHI